MCDKCKPSIKILALWLGIDQTSRILLTRYRDVSRDANRSAPKKIFKQFQQNQPKGAPFGCFGTVDFEFFFIFPFSKTVFCVSKVDLLSCRCYSTTEVVSIVVPEQRWKRFDLFSRRFWRKVPEFVGSFFTRKLHFFEVFLKSTFWGPLLKVSKGSPFILHILQQKGVSKSSKGPLFYNFNNFALFESWI